MPGTGLGDKELFIHENLEIPALRRLMNGWKGKCMKKDADMVYGGTMRKLCTVIKGH